MIIHGCKVDKLQLKRAKLQDNPSSCALKLLSCLFTEEELSSGNISGKSKSKDPDRVANIKQLDPRRIAYIHGRYTHAYASIR